MSFMYTDVSLPFSYSQEHIKCIKALFPILVNWILTEKWNVTDLNDIYKKITLQKCYKITQICYTVSVTHQTALLMMRESTEPVCILARQLNSSSLTNFSPEEEQNKLVSCSKKNLIETIYISGYMFVFACAYFFPLKIVMRLMNACSKAEFLPHFNEHRPSQKLL